MRCCSSLDLIVTLCRWPQTEWSEWEWDDLEMQGHSSRLRDVQTDHSHGCKFSTQNIDWHQLSPQMLLDQLTSSSILLLVHSITFSFSRVEATLCWPNAVRTLNWRKCKWIAAWQFKYQHLYAQVVLVQWLWLYSFIYYYSHNLLALCMICIGIGTAVERCSLMKLTSGSWSQICCFQLFLTSLDWNNLPVVTP